MSVTIYHNPRCSKSRQTLSLLQEKSININVIEYLKTPPDILQLKQILKQLGYEPRQLMRKSEQIYKNLDLGNENKTAEDFPPDPSRGTLTSLDANKSQEGVITERPSPL